MEESLSLPGNCGLQQQIGYEPDMDAEQLACTPEEIRELREIARGTHTGIWRIKRAKIILGTIAGRTVPELVLDVRVVPESIKKCLQQFSEKRMRFFDKPHRVPTWRETAAERVLLFLDHPPPKRSRKWDQVKVGYYGRDFSAREIQDIRELMASEPQWTRQRIARWLCLQYNLYQDNGKPRGTTAAIMLKRMDMDNMIRLRPNPVNTRKPKQDNKTFTQVHEPGKELSLDAVRQNPIQFVPVTTASDNDLWNGVIQRYHYIHTYQLWGAQMRYLVYGGEIVGAQEENMPAQGDRQARRPENQGEKNDRREHLLAVLGFAAGSWHLASRDEFIGWTKEARTLNIKRVVNNVRFLILPWIRSPNLASRILGGVTRRLPHDWEARYNYRPALLETFVQLDQYRGTCYQAANWIRVGTTKGYGIGNEKKTENTISKAIFLYPLDRNFRNILCET